ncbi:MAG: hypothetical protein LBR68_06600 [Lachnoclostridium sp.]|nr:hypothetical protein [Lachnoclostridium sp.]
MKIIIISITGIFCILSVVMIQSSINSRSAREAELRDSLSASISQTMREVMEKDGHGMSNEKEFVAAFLQSFLIKINSDVDVKVKIISLDLTEGLLDIEVEAAYEDVKQARKVLTLRRTVVYEGK